MGAACCAAAKDRTILNGRSEVLQRHVPHSPPWSLRWDNCGRVAGEEITANWLCNGGGGNARVEVKSSTTVETSFASSQLDGVQSIPWPKSPVPEGNANVLRLLAPDQAVSQKLVEVKKSTESPSASYPSPVKQSPLAPSVSLPPSSQGQLLPPNLTPSRWHRRSPGHQLLCQVSASRIPEKKSPTFSVSEDSSLFLPSAWSNESTRGSIGGSSDSWSIPVFSELMCTRRERWSFDSENSGFSLDKISRLSGRNSRSSSIDLQTCGVCTKLLTDRCQKIISTNELAVVSVLTCGHVYHAECLEYMTPENSKYDPACPVCTYGEKRAVKISEMALRAELELKARKRSRKRVVDSDLTSNIVLDPKMSSSTNMKSFLGKKPFLKRHFSFNLKASRSFSENQSNKKGFFWARSSKY